MPRGCGVRSQGGLYVCVPISPDGKPLEFFMSDPAVPWKGAKTLRAPQLIEERRGTRHLLMGVGKEFYPYPSDFLEEARVLGVSRKIPKNFNFEGLDPKRSKLLLMHPRAIPLIDYETQHFCPKEKSRRNDPRPIHKENIERFLITTDSRTDHRCLGAAYSLSMIFEGDGEAHQLEALDDAWIWGKAKTPSCSYESPFPIKPRGIEEALEIWKTLGVAEIWGPGIILIFPMFHFEYIDRKKSAPPLKQKIEKLGWDFKVEPE